MKSSPATTTGECATVHFWHSLKEARWINGNILRWLAEHCNYGDLLNDMPRDRLVCVRDWSAGCLQKQVWHSRRHMILCRLWRQSSEMQRSCKGQFQKRYTRCTRRQKGQRLTETESATGAGKSHANFERVNATTARWWGTFRELAVTSEVQNHHFWTSCNSTSEGWRVFIVHKCQGGSEVNYDIDY